MDISLKTLESMYKERFRSLVTKSKGLETRADPEVLLGEGTYRRGSRGLKIWNYSQ